MMARLTIDYYNDILLLLFIFFQIKMVDEKIDDSLFFL